ncbi:AMP-dependent synthetase/ligase [Balneatrix alpica]|uniref:AMP-dependent synthetase/ligase n=1 Tax=Balneatrix alpica TaxID=75684 RepID=A0ABV5Z771_9GAMM|nr:long-chain fatty acid--CoA ligase [Balneatrix alpica]
MKTKDVIFFEQATTVPALFLERVRRSEEQTAYQVHDAATRQWKGVSWKEVAKEAARWQQAFRNEGLQAGDRVALMIKNSLDWVLFDLAALGLGLVTVPLYINDRVGNVAHILQDTEAKLVLFSSSSQWRQLQDMEAQLPHLQRVLALQPDERSDITALEDWLPPHADLPYALAQVEPDSLATIVYTSGTTGLPKGVMLSHRNMLMDASSSLEFIDGYQEDIFLSVLPLSHMLERTGGYYIPMMLGASVAHARGIETLAHDLKQVAPTIMIAVPRLFERFYRKIVDALKDQPQKRRLFRLAVKAGWRQFMYQQGEMRWHPLCLLAPILVPKVSQNIRDAFGGRLRIAVSGGAALANELAEIFCGLGMNLLQGYGLTEASPVVSVNHLTGNHPFSVGRPLSHLQIRLGENGELLVKGDSVMQGYWKQADATAAILDADGWLSTGDLAEIDQRGRIHIRGRAKDIMVLSNGENISPNDLEQAMALDPLVEQIMVAGDGQAFLTAIVVVNPENWRDYCQSEGLNPKQLQELPQAARTKLVRRLNGSLGQMPGYAKIRQVLLTDQGWTVENQCLTPTLKLRRLQIMARFKEQLKSIYSQMPS